MSSPLIETLFRPTTSAPAPAPRVRADASAAPVRAKGSHTRAGNAMNRTRAALLTGAARAVEESGTKITMAQVATSSGVAKATLYNHFRTRDAVLAALVVDQVNQLVAAQEGKPLERALTDAALALSAHPVRRALARIEPAVLAELGRIDDAAEGWRVARQAAREALDAAGRAGTTTVLRWLASFVLTPADEYTVGADVAVLLAGLPRVTVAEARPA